MNAASNACSEENVFVKLGSLLDFSPQISVRNIRALQPDPRSVGLVLGQVV